MTSAKGLHLWLATFSPYSKGFWITTRRREPQLAIKRSQQVAKEEGSNISFERIEYKGTIDA